MCLERDGDGEVAHNERGASGEDRLDERKESHGETERKKGGWSRRSRKQFCEPVTH